MAMGRGLIGRIQFSNYIFAMHADSHATSMVDCGIEGKC